MSFVSSLSNPRGGPGDNGSLVSPVVLPQGGPVGLQVLANAAPVPVVHGAPVPVVHGAPVPVANGAPVSVVHAAPVPVANAALAMRGGGVWDDLFWNVLMPDGVCRGDHVMRNFLQDGNFNKLCMAVTALTPADRLEQAVAHVKPFVQPLVQPLVQNTAKDVKSDECDQPIRAMLKTIPVFDRLVRNTLMDPSQSQPIDTIYHEALYSHRMRYSEIVQSKKVFTIMCQAVLNFIRQKNVPNFSQVRRDVELSIKNATFFRDFKAVLNGWRQTFLLSSGDISKIAEAAATRIINAYPAFHIEVMPELKQIVEQLFLGQSVDVVLPPGKGGTALRFKEGINPPFTFFTLTDHSAEQAPAIAVPPQAALGRISAQASAMVVLPQAALGRISAQASAMVVLPQAALGRISAHAPAMVVLPQASVGSQVAQASAMVVLPQAGVGSPLAQAPAMGVPPQTGVGSQLAHAPAMGVVRPIAVRPQAGVARGVLPQSAPLAGSGAGSYRAALAPVMASAAPPVHGGGGGVVTAPAAGDAHRLPSSQTHPVDALKRRGDVGLGSAFQRPGQRPGPDALSILADVALGGASPLASKRPRQHPLATLAEVALGDAGIPQGTHGGGG